MRMVMKTNQHQAARSVSREPHGGRSLKNLGMKEWSAMVQGQLELRSSMEAEKAKVREEELFLLHRRFKQEKLECY